MKKQTEDARHKGEAQIAATCEQGLQEMQGVMFGKDGPCPTRRPEFCKRLQTQDGYVKFRDATADTGQLPGYAAADQLKMCGLSEAAVLAKLCPKAASAVDFRFVHDSCPSQRPALCDDAMERKELWYIAEHCAAERTQLVAENCVGRKYSAQIAPEYRDFCTGSLGANLGGSTPAGAGEVQEPQKPEDKVEQGVKKGLEGLKKIFGN